MMKRLHIFACWMLGGLLLLASACQDIGQQPEKKALTVTVYDIDILSTKVKVEVLDSNTVYFLTAWPQASVDKYLINHTQKELNESFVNAIVGDSITPAIFAKDYCIQGNFNGTITGLTGNSLYYVIAFTYDAKTQKVGDICYRQSFKTRSQSNVQLSFDIQVTNILDTAATVCVTPSDTMVYYYYLMIDSSMVKSPFYGNGSALRAAQYIMSEYKTTIDEYNESMSSDYNFYDFPYASIRAYKGVDQGVFNGLGSDKDYLLIAFKTTQYCDVVEPITVKTFRTQPKKITVN